MWKVFGMLSQRWLISNDFLRSTSFFLKIKSRLSPRITYLKSKHPQIQNIPYPFSLTVYVWLLISLITILIHSPQNTRPLVIFRRSQRACVSDCSRLFAGVLTWVLQIWQIFWVSAANMSVSETKTSQGIPSAEFIEDVDAYMSKRADKETPEEVVSVSTTTGFWILKLHSAS